MSYASSIFILDLKQNFGLRYIAYILRDRNSIKLLTFNSEQRRSRLGEKLCLRKKSWRKMPWKEISSLIILRTAACATRYSLVKRSARMKEKENWFRDFRKFVKLTCSRSGPKDPRTLYSIADLFPRDSENLIQV